MIRLGINIDHVATLRQARLESYPSPVQAAALAELGGADNITCHLREDRRHIQDSDVRLLKDTIQVPLNFEMAASSEMISFAKELRPKAVTLVPEKREELTTEGGLDVLKKMKDLQKAVNTLKESQILVALFVEADLKTLDACKEIGADAVEIHTGGFCHSMDKCRYTKEKESLIEPLQFASKHAHELGLQVHFGHGLHYNNASWLQSIPFVEEANIGHAVIARALFIGMEKAVREMKELLNNSNYKPVENFR